MVAVSLKKFFFKQKTAYEMTDVTGVQTCALPIWANPETGCSANFWLRAMGWFLVAMVDVLERDRKSVV